MPLRKNRMGRGPDGAGQRREEPEERQTLDTLFSVTYEELHRLASAVKRSDANATLSPTTLVNEAWLKLASSPEFAAESRLHFKRIAARAFVRRRQRDGRLELMADAPEPSPAQSIFTAVQSQLGLKLEPKRGPVDTLVVDKAEKVPIDN